MLIDIKRRELDALDDASLIWTCVEPTIKEIRGKSLSVKMEASSGLTEGQRALLMFQVLFGHSKGGVEGLFLQLDYMLSGKGVWNEFRNSARLFKDDRLFQLYDKLENAYFEKAEALPGLDDELNGILPESIKSAAAYIRGAPNDFVRFID